ncbi:MAG: hypothetical protein K0A90_01150 [Methanosarcinaceae archaeon]|nr:hypothetical protein [Methanosarcinaceae archaeon]
MGVYDLHERGAWNLTEKVVETISDKICEKIGKLCDYEILLLNKNIFVAFYKDKKIDLDIMESMKQPVRKDSKVLVREKGDFSRT